jgi:hypothetical protein
LDVDEAGDTSLDCRWAAAVAAAGTAGAADILVSSAEISFFTIVNQIVQLHKNEDFPKIAIVA